MKLLLTTISACILALSSQMLLANNQSAYTSIESKHCVVIDSSELIKEPEIDFYHAECPSLGGYRIFVAGGDLRYNLQLQFGDKEFPLKNFATFHELGSKLVEWRYRRITKNDAPSEVEYTALIYRLNYQDDNKDRDVETLVVARLNKEKTCVIGVIEQGKKMNEKARKLADNKDAVCVSGRE